MASADFGERPRARCDPIERRRRPTCTGRGSRLWARAWRCRPDARPSIETSAASGRLGDLADGGDPTVVELAGGDRRRRPTAVPPGADGGTSSSASGGTTSRPSGLATALATLARNLVRATPTVIGRPTRSRTSRRSATAISVGVPETLRRPPTSRNASSIDSPSTSGVVSSNTANTALLASEYADMRGRPRSLAGTAGGPARRPSPSARRTPSPRSWPRGRPPTRRSRAGREAEDRRAARPTRRTSRGRRAGSWLHPSRHRRSRTYVRTR